VRAGRIIATGFVLAALIAGGGAVAVSRIDPVAIKDFLTDAARQASGREVVVRGSTDLELFPAPTLIAENVVFGNAAWSVSPDMGRVKRLEARVAWLPLFLGQVRITRFRLVEPHLLLERDSNGRRNWDFDTGGAEPSGERAFLARLHALVEMVVSEIQIVDGTVSLRRGTRTRILRIPRLSAYGDVGNDALHVAGQGHFAGRDWRLTGSVGALSTLLDNQPYALGFVLRSGGIRLTGDGAIERPLDGTGLGLELKLAAASARDLASLGGHDVDLPGAVEGRATLADRDGVARLVVHEAHMRIADARVSMEGSIEDLAGAPDVRLRVDVKAKSLAGVATLAGVDLPRAGRLEASAAIGNSKGRFRMHDLSGTLQLGGATVRLDGGIRDLVRQRGIDIGVELETPSLARLSRYVGVALPAVGPVEARARVGRTRHGYKLAKLEARVARSDVRGELYVYPHRKRPRIVGKLQAERLDLDPYLPAAAEGGDTRVFSRVPFSVDWLRDLDGELAVHANILRVRGVEIARARIGMALRQGKLLFTPAGALGGGEFKAKLALDARGQRPHVALRIRGKGIGLGKVASQIYETELVEGARADVNIDVAGRGRSLAELMAGLSGGVYVAAGKATVHNARLEKISGDMVTTILSTVAMQSPDDATTHVRCGVVRVIVKEGSVDIDRTVAMETTRAAMSTSGNINLKDESLDLGVSLVGRTGPSLSAGSFSGLVRVRGSIAEPEVVADPAAIAGAAATVAGAVATSGLSLIAQGLISQLAADRSTCETAFEIGTGEHRDRVATNHAGSRDAEDFSSRAGARERPPETAATPVSGERD